MTDICQIGDTTCNLVGTRLNWVWTQHWLWYENLIKFSTQISPHALHSFSDIVMPQLTVFSGWSEIRDRLYGFIQKIRDE